MDDSNCPLCDLPLEIKKGLNQLHQLVLLIKQDQHPELKEKYLDELYKRLNELENRFASELCEAGKRAERWRAKALKKK